MNALPAAISIFGSCDQTLQRVKRALSCRGLRTLETFDLQDARLALADCPCPHHGMQQCDCQMIVLMIYGEGVMPTTLTLHGNDGQTWISLVSQPDQDPDARTRAVIQQALAELSGA
jgi:hypothetical protein